MNLSCLLTITIINLSFPNVILHIHFFSVSICNFNYISFRKLSNQRPSFASQSHSCNYTQNPRAFSYLSPYKSTLLLLHLSLPLSSQTKQKKTHTKLTTLRCQHAAKSDTLCNSVRCYEDGAKRQLCPLVAYHLMYQLDMWQSLWASIVEDLLYVQRT